MKVILFKTALAGILIGLTKFPKSSLTISKSPSLTIQVSNLWGLYETLSILTIKGKVSDSPSSSSPAGGGQGFSLQGLVKIASPVQGPALGSDPYTQTLCKV